LLNNRKLPFSSELAYALGILLMALGVSLVSLSNFGYSMIVAPVYLIFARLGGLITFGMTEYLFQGLLLGLMCLVLRRFRLPYLFSFVTAVLYGVTFDGALWLLGNLPADRLGWRILWFCLGTVCISLSVAFFVRTYLAPEVYELIVREFSARFSLDFGRVKLIYDLSSLGFSILLSLLLFGPGVFGRFSWAALGQAILDGFILEGIGIGTLIAALINGPIISFCGKFLDDRLEFTAIEALKKRMG